MKISERVARLHQEVLHTPPALCAERALLVTDYFRQRANRRKPMLQQKAEALAHILRHKKAIIYPEELLIGCFCSHRVGGGLLPELHGIAMLEDLFSFPHREVNPIVVSKDTRYKLLSKVIPYWLPRFLALKIRPRSRALSFVIDQLNATRYLINETGGISHFVPDYSRLLALGTTGYRAEVAQRLKQVPPDSVQAQFLEAVVTVCDGLDAFAASYASEARRQAQSAEDQVRQEELLHLAKICDHVPKQPAQSFHEALQCLVFAQIALNLESLDNSVSPGRLDQILWPYFQGDCQAGTTTPDQALELLGCYAVKLCEIVPIFSRRVSRFHGGMFNGQVVVVGGRDEEGRDATNELTYLLLTLMDQLRTRQPNYHARIHEGSPNKYRSQIAKTLASGAVSPALYNDEIITPILQSRGVSEADSHNYALVGCVEPVAAGKSYFSTDAALANLPLCLELALNQGRRFNKWRRPGAATAPAEDCTNIEEVLELF
ncbi:MAG: formate acetyltransferase, partial [Proteobacteria bacterium]|nr:formate acetyltransferase [Pseudomonadota bacterium]